MAVLLVASLLNFLICSVQIMADDDAVQLQTDQIILPTAEPLPDERATAQAETLSLVTRQVQLDSDHSPADQIDSPEDNNLQASAEPGKGDDGGLTFEEWKSLEKDDIVEQENIPKLSDLSNLINYAASDCGAQVLESSADVKSAGGLLRSAKDTYLIAPCEHDFMVVVELCDNILIREIRLANYEMFSSMIKQLDVYASDTYKSDSEWDLIAQLDIADHRQLQKFPLDDVPSFARYVKLQAVGYHGDEFYCPLNVIQIYGISMLEEFQFIRGETNPTKAPDVDNEPRTTDGDPGSGVEKLTSFVSNVGKTMVSLFRGSVSNSVPKLRGQHCEANNATELNTCPNPYAIFFEAAGAFQPTKSTRPKQRENDVGTPQAQDEVEDSVSPSFTPVLTMDLATEAIRMLTTSSPSASMHLEQATTSTAMAVTPGIGTESLPVPTAVQPSSSEQHMSTAGVVSQTTHVLASTTPLVSAVSITDTTLQLQDSSLLTSTAAPAAAGDSVLPTTTASSSITADKSAPLSSGGKGIKGSALAQLRAMILNVEKNLSLTNKYLDKLSHRTLTFSRFINSNFTHFRNETTSLLDVLQLMTAHIDHQRQQIETLSGQMQVVAGDQWFWMLVIYSIPGVVLLLLQVRYHHLHLKALQEATQAVQHAHSMSFADEASFRYETSTPFKRPGPTPRRGGRPDSLPTRPESPKFD